MSPFRLLYVADPMCSWCWGFSPVLEELSTAFDLPVDVVVGGLRPGASAQPMDRPMSRYLRATWTRIAKMTGQPFDHEPLGWTDWVYDTLAPAQAVVAARDMDPGLALPLFTRLQRAFYVESVDVTRVEALPPLAADVGLDTAAFLLRLRSEENQAATWNDFGKARDMGISGFPALLAVADGRTRAVTLGYAPAERLLGVLEAMVRDFDAPGPVA